MTIDRFYITHIALIGSDVPKAEVNFKPGLNVISGPSDSGKTFILQCIDFMLGAKTPPKRIDEAANYNFIQIGLSSQDQDREVILERSIKGGDFNLYEKNDESKTLGAKHQDGNKNTISSFLLMLSGLENKKVRTNKGGTTRSLSFRDIARLILVNEETIIRELSPIYSLRGGYSTRPVESSIFRLMLSGTDDASVIASENIKIARGKQQGKTELLDELLNRTRQRLAEADLSGDQAEWQQQLNIVESLFTIASEELAVEQKTVAIIEERRRAVWTRLRRIESKKDVLSELQQRFDLLHQQYSSDLLRLETVAEASLRLGQMKEERCPVCGSLAEYHILIHQKPEASPEDVAKACIVEANKIRVLLVDLKSTQNINDAEIKQLVINIESEQTDLKIILDEITERISPRVNAALQKLRDSQDKRDTYRAAVEMRSREEELAELLREVQEMKPKNPNKGTTTKVGADETEDFCLEVEALLKSWKFPDTGRVTFSEEDQDLVISGRDRTSHGKGVRAIFHSAFNLALLKLALEEQLPHPGFVVLDSPLVVYREPDTDEGNFSRDVKDAFFRLVSDQFSSAQVIVFENEDPPADIAKSANVIKFTGANHGRRGFIPLTH
ncbi:MAG: AAA family ATPase [Nitrospirota bacterium]